MKYQNATDVLPRNLLEELQRYLGGCIVYIPQRDGVRSAWGEKSGARQDLIRRNESIKLEFHGGQSIDHLAERYALSVESIKRIVYTK